MNAASRFLAPAQRMLHVYDGAEGAPMLQLPSGEGDQVRSLRWSSQVRRLRAAGVLLL